MVTAQVQTKKYRTKAEQAEIIKEVKVALNLFSSKMSLRQIYYQLEPHRALLDAQLEAQIISELIKWGIYDYSEALRVADTNELKVTRFNMKIEFLTHVKSSIENIMIALMKKEELELEAQKIHPKEHLVKTESIKESADHLITHINEKIAVCEKMSGKLNVKS